MTTSELIAALQQYDPSGKQQVFCHAIESEADYRLIDAVPIDGTPNSNRPDSYVEHHHGAMT